METVEQEVRRRAKVNKKKKETLRWRAKMMEKKEIVIMKIFSQVRVGG